MEYSLKYPLKRITLDSRGVRACTGVGWGGQWGDGYTYNTLINTKSIKKRITLK